jgi:hypothetical protein
MGKHSGGSSGSIVPHPIHKGRHGDGGKILKAIAKALKGKKSK